MTAPAQPAPPAQSAEVLPTTLTVRVTAEDILLGQRKNGRECPIARATRRTLVLQGLRPLDGGVMVGGVVYDSWDCAVEIESHMYRGEGVASFVTEFDCSGPCAPTTFTLVQL